MFDKPHIASRIICPFDGQRMLGRPGFDGWVFICSCGFSEADLLSAKEMVENAVGGELLSSPGETPISAQPKPDQASRAAA
ncbi:hypothetical protein HYW67_02705 [Candidatus Parcubacteria bacterium]|nr:hypothetical protein [Candidatus Parcubacteria bacterium]